MTMNSILGQLSFCLNFITLEDDEGEDYIEDENLIIQLIMNHTDRQSTKGIRLILYLF